jgi:hypothetical protein
LACASLSASRARSTTFVLVAEFHRNVAFARIRAHGELIPVERRNATLKLFDNPGHPTAG